MSESASVDSTDILKALVEQIAQMNSLQASMLMGNTQSTGLSKELETNKIISNLTSRIEKFMFDPHNDLTFPAWYNRYKPIITGNGCNLDDKTKVNLLLSKLDAREYKQYQAQISPADPYEQSLEETVKVLSSIFDVKRSVFTSRFQCLKITKGNSESLLDYTGRVNEMCEQAKLSSMKINDWKCLLWLSGLDGASDNDVRPRLLAFLDRMIEQSKEVKLQDLYAEYDKISTFKRESRMIERRSMQVNAVASRMRSSSVGARSSGGTSECFNCGNIGHFSRDCSKAKAKCARCEGSGHIERFCGRMKGGKKKIFKRRSTPGRVNHVETIERKVSNAIAAVNVVRQFMKVPVNGQEIVFQLDTGSDITLLSVKDWEKLGGPSMRPNTTTVKVANGQGLNILGVISCEFELKNQLYSGDAYICEGNSLLGMEWLNKSEEILRHFEEVVSVAGIAPSKEVVVNAVNKDCDFKIEYAETEEFGQADAVSGTGLIQQGTSVSEDVKVASIEADVWRAVADKVRKLPITSDDIATETWRDPQMRKILKNVKSGKWPEFRHADDNLKPFVSKRESLSVVNGILLDGDRVVVPQIFRKQVLEELHVGHNGIEKMRKLARSTVYWPNLDKEIPDFVKKCRSCVENSKTPVKVPLQPWPTPKGAWERVHIDYAGPIDDYHYLVAVDAYSKWPEVAMVKTTTAYNTVSILKIWCARHGAPQVIVSDNGPQFTSAEFENFCAEWGIDHVRSPAYHPQSNGQAERFVDTLKRGLKKLKGEGRVTDDAFQTFLIAYRSTPCNSINDKSPAELFLGRKLRTRLSLLSPKTSSGPFAGLNSNAQRNMKDQFDAHHGVRPRSFSTNDAVLVKRYRNNAWSWVEGKIVNPVGKVLFVVETNDGRRARYHMNQMKPSKLDEEHITMDGDIWLEEMLETFDLAEAMQQPLSTPPRKNGSSNSTSVAVVPVQPSTPAPSLVDVPRRSARVRRPVIRFDPSVYLIQSRR